MQGARARRTLLVVRVGRDGASGLGVPHDDVGVGAGLDDALARVDVEDLGGVGRGDVDELVARELALVDAVLPQDGQPILEAACAVGNDAEVLRARRTGWWVAGRRQGPKRVSVRERTGHSRAAAAHSRAAAGCADRDTCASLQFGKERVQASSVHAKEGGRGGGSGSRAHSCRPPSAGSRTSSDPWRWSERCRR